MKNPDPPNFFASKYSLPHVAAVMIVKGNAGHSAVNDEAVNDPAIGALRQRIHVTEDPKMSAVAPRLRPARVTLTLKDGRTETHEGESHRGDFTQPFEEHEILDKFRELAGHVLPSDKVARAEESLARVEEWKTVRELAVSLRGTQ
jgi:2-methylcitrate dehydratase PrpD